MKPITSEGARELIELCCVGDNQIVVDVDTIWKLNQEGACLQAFEKKRNYGWED